MRNLLLAWFPDKIRVCSRDTEKGLEYVTSEIPGRNVRRVVRHHRDNKIVRGRGDERGREERCKVVRVRHDRAESVGCKDLRESIESVSVSRHPGYKRVFEALDAERVCISTVDVRVTSRDG